MIIAAMLQWNYELPAQQQCCQYHSALRFLLDRSANLSTHTCKELPAPMGQCSRCGILCERSTGTSGMCLECCVEAEKCTSAGLAYAKSSASDEDLPEDGELPVVPSGCKPKVLGLCYEM